MPNLSGKTINQRYKVIESIGRGGMAEVYKVMIDHRAAHLTMKVLHRFQHKAKTLVGCKQK